MQILFFIQSYPNIFLFNQTFALSVALRTVGDAGPYRHIFHYTLFPCFLFSHRLTFTEPRDYRVVFVLQTDRLARGQAGLFLYTLSQS